ncbi:hypothetical protein DFH06DRAFT_1367745 [Mycena polygramma]|nr:hypothetical protein DFH06DRAFT_1367745 [Mycena polygramma]
MPSYVVTGAARGIGFEFVNQLSADSSNTVFAVVRNKTTATQLATLARKNIMVLDADITDPKAQHFWSSKARIVSKVTGGKLDFLINNAGIINHPGFTIDRFPSPEALENELLANFKTNTIGVVHTINAFLPLLKKSVAKKVLTLSSAYGDLDFTLAAEATGEPAYSISKAVLNMVVAKYAAQYKADGFVFLAISPGLVKTTMLPDPDGEEVKMLSEAINKIAPDFKGPISPEESVKMQLEVFNRWSVEELGAFVSHFGTNQLL